MIGFLMNKNWKRHGKAWSWLDLWRRSGVFRYGLKAIIEDESRWMIHASGCEPRLLWTRWCNIWTYENADFLPQLTSVTCDTVLCHRSVPRELPQTGCFVLKRHGDRQRTGSTCVVLVVSCSANISRRIELPVTYIPSTMQSLLVYLSQIQPYANTCLYVP